MALTSDVHERLAIGFEDKLQPELLKWFERRVVDSGLENDRPKFNVLVGNALAHIFSVYSAYTKDFNLNEVWPTKPDVLSELNSTMSSELQNLDAKFHEVVFGGDDERLYIRFSVQHTINNIRFSYFYDYGSNPVIHLTSLSAASGSDDALNKADIDKIIFEFNKLKTFELLKK